MKMTFSGDDFRRIRWSLVLLALLSLLGVAVVFGAMQVDKSTSAEARDVEVERNEILGKLARARDEEQEIRAKIERYQEIIARGYVTDEQRLDWVEQIAQIKAARKLIDVQYEIAPRKTADSSLLPEGAAGGGYEFMSSTMKLRMQLLHENDLLGFLSDLQQHVHALLVVRSCDIERLPAVEGGRAVSAQLKAACEIDWITLMEKK